MENTTRLMDTVNSLEGRAFVTRNGQNRKLFELTKITATAKLKTKTKQMLGNRIEQVKPIGMSITGNLSCYLMTSDWIEYARKYKETGVLEPITIQTTMEDNNSTVGRSTILLKDVILTDIGLMNIDDSSDDASTWDSDFTAGDFEIIEKFSPPENFR